jgi:hypothetical protein
MNAQPYTTQTSSTAATEASVSRVHASGAAKNGPKSSQDDRVSLHPLGAAEALKALLNTPPVKDEED